MKKVNSNEEKTGLKLNSAGCYANRKAHGNILNLGGLGYTNITVAQWQILSITTFSIFLIKQPSTVGLTTLTKCLSVG